MNDVLSPNHQLFVILGAILLACAFIGTLFGLGMRKMNAMSQQFGVPVPLWSNVLHELFAIMRHPHDWAIEADELMREAEAVTVLKMAPERYKRLLELIAERVLMRDPDLRHNESRAAAMALLVIPFVRDEQRSLKELTGVRLVGSQAPAHQSAQDASTRNNAP